MAPKEPFKVHSLAKHVEDTNKGLSASAQYNRRPGSKAAAVPVKKEPGLANASLFGNNDDSDESSDSSDSDSDEENSTDFIKKIGANGTKPSATPTPKRRSRDEEIADSDVERNASAKKAAAVKKEKVEESSSESSSDSSSESESEESEPKAKTNGASAKPAAAAQDSSSSSSEEESEDEDESSDEDETSKAVAKMLTIPAALKGTKDAAKANTKAAAKENSKPVAKKDELSSSSEEESSEEESSEEESSDNEAEPTKPEATKPAAATPKAAKPVAATPKAAKPVPTTPKGADPEAIRKALKDSSMETESESESESESEASEEEESDDQVDESMQISDREMDKQLGVPKFIAPDFTLRKGDDGANGQDVARICNEANLQGKQVWYFTVPSNVPISVIQNMEIPMDRSQLGGPVFSHDGQDYGVSFDAITPRSSIQILIPSSGDSNYRSAGQQVDQTMHIKRITSLGGAGASTTGPAPRRAPRPQPKGLKARYQPFGVNTPMGNIGADTPGDEDVEMEEATQTVATPKSAKKSKSKDKKKGSDEAATADRKGKRKHNVSEDDASDAARQLAEENESAETKSKKQKVARASSPDLGTELPTINKKQTPIAPPAIPSSAYSSSAAAIATPSKPAAATPSAAKKSSKKAKPETPVPTSRQTAVPLPNIPLTSRPKESPVPLPPSSGLVASTPLQSKSKKSKKSKDEVTATGSSQQSPPPSAQGGDKKKSASKASKLG
ncbi:hypothetical protein FP744_10007647 [Trichoderma asperellum]|nr:DNA-directed RNA polymerase I subunit RPA34.5-domain-containing protein [Trichoderma asperelloides]